MFYTRKITNGWGIGKFVAKSLRLNTNMSVYKQSTNLEKAGEVQKIKKSTNPQLLIQPLLNFYINLKKEHVGGKILTVLFFTTPWNLGKHFEVRESFIDGVLSPYLTPTLYLQDILIFCSVLYLIVRRFLNHKDRDFECSSSLFGYDIPIRLSSLFLLGCFLSLFFVERLIPSVYLFCRMFLYFLLLVLGLSLFRSSFVRCTFSLSLVFNVVFLSILGLLQFAHQRSVFDNYLFFGEQPYNVYTPYIAKESYSGVAKIPPYGLFQHPNIFAGYLCISLTLLWLAVRDGSCREKAKLCVAIIPVTALGAYTLLLTKSLTGIYAFILGAVLLLLVSGRSFLKNMLLFRVRRVPVCILCLFSIVLGLSIIVSGFLLPSYGRFVEKALPSDSILSSFSVNRRVALLESAIKMVEQKPFYGWGLNSFVYTFQRFYVFSDPVRFIQPVHNIYALLASEIGLVGLVWFVALAVYVIFYSFRYGYPVYGVVLLQIIFISSFDHYFFTIHQTFLFFILTLGFALTYTKNTDCL